MNLHPSLYKALLAGVARAPLGPDSAGPALQTVLTAVPDAARLWHSVAAADLWQRAGFQPSQGAPQAPCMAEPTCTRAAEQVLQLILRGIHAEQLDSWLALAQRHGMTLPHAALVPLIELGMNKPALRLALDSLLGARGRWLVAQHTAWSATYGVCGEAPDTHWQLGNLAQRCAAFEAMRRADPAAALAALDAGWAQEPVENRIALLPCLATGLGLHDEDFLERALDDKRKEVRAAAQQLLASLPGSQLGQRCLARLTALLTLERKSGLGARLGALLGAEALPQLTVALPDVCDKAMKRDGIGNQAYHGMGEKAGWLLDLMRCVAPAHWSGTWELTPRQVLDVLAQQEFKTALLTGLVQAAARALCVQPGAADIDWFVMLAVEDTHKATGLNIPAMLLADMARLPQAAQERIVLRWLDPASPTPNGSYGHALTWAGQRYGSGADALSPQLSRLMLAAARRQMTGAPQPGYSTRGQFAVLATALDPGIAAEAKAGWPAGDWEHWPHWRTVVDDLMDTLQFRHTMQQSFLESDQ